MKRAIRWLAQLAVLALPALAAAGTDPGPARNAFVAAYAEADAGIAAPAGGDPAVLTDYVLYPYLLAARLRAAIRIVPADTGESPTDIATAEFLARYGTDPVARLVRRPWLESLAGRRRWEPFLAAYATANGPSQALRCAAIEARIALARTDGLAEAVVAEWLTPRSAPGACDPGFNWLRSRGTLDAAMVEQRARLALAQGEAGLARFLARSLPEPAARPLREWATLIENPQAAIDALIASPGTPVENDALLDGWSRLARRNSDAAHDRFDALVAARQLDGAQASRHAKPLALGLAWSRRSRALEYFAKIAAADYDDVTHEWRVRAALWAGDWALVASAIEAMPATLSSEARWRYWAARAREVRGDPEAARTLYAAVIPTDNWYAVLAAARLGESFAPHQQPLAVDAESLAALEATPAFVRARELLQAELPALAQAEWNAGYEPLDPPARKTAIVLAARWGWHFQAIATAARQRLFEDYDLLYPRPFEATVLEAAELTNLPPTLIYSVIRQESLYQPWAESGAGAIGLMQLLPETARRTAAQLDRPRPTRSGLTRPEINVPLGAGFLASLIERFDGQVVLALAGYNAGPGAVRRWLPDRRIEVDAWVENIPFNETRAYVQKVMWHSVVFEWLADGKPENAAAWLAKVAPVT
jgi:soluble lytic murein transglycosylase